MHRSAAIAFAASLMGWGSTAAAHHVSGHAGAGSEGVRNLNSLGQSSGKAQSRLFVMNSVSHTSASPADTTIMTSFIGDVQVHPWVSVGAEVGVRSIREEGRSPEPGFGDTRASVRITPHGDKLLHRVLTFGLTATFPTHTSQRSDDPDRAWGVSPFVLYTRTYEKLFWQAMGLASVDIRPTGVAIDASAAGQIGYRVLDRLSPSLGASVDVRAAAFCEDLGGFCSQGRLRERDGSVGTTRVTLLGRLGYLMTDDAALTVGVDVPVTPAKPFDVAGNLGVQWIF